MVLYEYTGQTITDTRALRAALLAAGESVAIYTVQGGNVSVEVSSINETLANAAVAAANT